MKKFKKITALLLCLVLCAGMACVSATAADYENVGLILVHDQAHKDFVSVYEVGHTFEMHITAYDVNPYDPEELFDVSLSGDEQWTVYNDADGVATEPMLTGTGGVIEWTPTTAGYYRLRIEIFKNDVLYQGVEVFQIGEPWDVKYAQIGYEEGSEVLYTGASVLNDMQVYHYPSNTILEKNKDYTISVKNPKGPGKCTVTVKGIGKCTGTLTVNFDIISPAAKFKDVKNSDWYIGAVNYAVYQKLFNGTSKTTFEPNAPMTRGMFVTVACRLLGIGDAKAPIACPFVDVQKDKYYYDAVTWAYGLRIIEGVDATHFAPNAPITREQMCTIIIRMNAPFAQLFEKAYEMDEDFLILMDQSGQKFKDHNKISDWAVTAVYQCRGENIVNGKQGNYFDPKGKATRAEVATIVLNYQMFLYETVRYNLGF